MWMIWVITWQSLIFALHFVEVSHTEMTNPWLCKDGRVCSVWCHVFVALSHLFKPPCGRKTVIHDVHVLALHYSHSCATWLTSCVLPFCAPDGKIKPMFLAAKHFCTWPHQTDGKSANRCTYCMFQITYHPNSAPTGDDHSPAGAWSDLALTHSKHLLNNSTDKRKKTNCFFSLQNLTALIKNCDLISWFGIFSIIIQ